MRWPAHVAGGGSLLDRRWAGAQVDQEIDDVGHPEHGGMAQGAAIRDTAGIARGAGLNVRSRLDENASDRGVAVAGSRDQRRLRVPGRAVNRRACVDQRARQRVGARDIAPDATRGVVAQHRHVPQRGRPVGVIAPMLHRSYRELGLVAQQRAQPCGLAAVEDLAAKDFCPQLRPACEAVLARDGELRRGQHEAVRNRLDASQRCSVAGASGAQ